MRCFYVFVHARLNWRKEHHDADARTKADHPIGFYCHRYVLASKADAARQTAFRQVRRNLDRQTGWLSTQAVTIELEAEELATAPMYNALKPDNVGHTFYSQD